MITTSGECREGVDDGCLAGCDGKCADAAFERCDAFFENSSGGIADACVDVAEFFEAEEACGVRGVIEDI